MRIAVVDDQPDEVIEIIDGLVASGMACMTYTSGEEVIAALRRETFDLLIVDWNMPRVDGLQVMKWAEDNLTDPPPVMILTSRTAKEDVVHALEAGAADYICKPEDAAVVRARAVSAIRRRSPARRDPQSRFGTFVFDDATLTVRYGDEAVELRNKEFELARLLFDNLDRPLSRGYILQRVWHTSPDVETRTLDMHVSRIRTKLGLRAERGFVLKSIFGFGYRLDTCGAAV